MLSVYFADIIAEVVLILPLPSFLISSGFV